MNPLTTLQVSLQGKKSYLIGLLLVFDALYVLLTGDRLVMSNMTFDNPTPGPDPVQQLLGGGGLMSLRAALSRKGTP